MSKNAQGIIAGIIFLIFAAIMIGFRYFFQSMSNDWLEGFLSGGFLMTGLLALASKTVRHID